MQFDYHFTRQSLHVIRYIPKPLIQMLLCVNRQCVIQFYGYICQNRKQFKASYEDEINYFISCLYFDVITNSHVNMTWINTWINVTEHKYMRVWGWLMLYIDWIVILLRGYCTLKLDLACFVCYFKIINIFFSKNNEWILALGKLSKELKNGIEICQVVLNFKTVKIMFDQNLRLKWYFRTTDDICTKFQVVSYVDMSLTCQNFLLIVDMKQRSQWQP